MVHFYFMGNNQFLVQKVKSMMAAVQRTYDLNQIKLTVAKVKTELPGFPS